MRVKEMQPTGFSATAIAPITAGLMTLAAPF